ncbi:hypothetical protein VTO42DRAFT_3200 [Malbranchea cinnamomea]
MSDTTRNPDPAASTSAQEQEQEEQSQSQSHDDDYLHYIQYDPSKENEYVPAMRQLISKDLSEPYSIYVYRYFLYQWGDLCFMCFDTRTSALAGVIVSKFETHSSPSGSSPFPPTKRGYIAMLAVHESYRGRGIATRLVRKAIDSMIARGADEVVLETEISNTPAIKLYQRLGFLRSKRLHRYYLNGNSAYRLVLPLKEASGGLGPPGENVVDAAQQHQHHHHHQQHEGGGAGDAGEECSGEHDDGLPLRENGEYPGRHVC